MFLVVIKSLVAVLGTLVLLGTLRPWQMEHSENQKLFANGAVPNPLPDGLYAGSVPGYKVSWLGKKFDAAHESGINVFTNGERYPFKTSASAGVRSAIQTLKIDYNAAENPLWLRPILDEIVEFAPGHYLGKLHVRIIPGYPFTLAYFELRK